MRRGPHRLSIGCQCCRHGKDAIRRVDKQRCCAVGECCGQRLARGPRPSPSAPSPDDWLPEDHLARFVADLVDEVLDLLPVLADYIENTAPALVSIETPKGLTNS
ncbi:MAG: hypothetical protein ACQSGP_29350 [Frankia sp.]